MINAIYCFVLKLVLPEQEPLHSNLSYFSCFTHFLPNKHQIIQYNDNRIKCGMSSISITMHCTNYKIY